MMHYNEQYFKEMKELRRSLENSNEEVDRLYHRVLYLSRHVSNLEQMNRDLVKQIREEHKKIRQAQAVLRL